MDGRKCDDPYSRDWRIRFPSVKLKTRAWITWSMPARVSFKSVMLSKEEEQIR